MKKKFTMINFLLLKKVVTIRPGEGRGSKNSTVEPLQTSVTEKESTTQDTLLDLVRLIKIRKSI
jgi:hypothetical protein